MTRRLRAHPAFIGAVKVAYKLRLDPVVVLRDPKEFNYWLRMAAANVISKAEAEENKKNKK